jgi:murein DD-endopeptidase MepM/ murein hydrolase activator NlpD
LSTRIAIRVTVTFAIVIMGPSMFGVGAGAAVIPEANAAPVSRESPVSVLQASAATTPAYGSYRWPVSGRVIRFFEAPATPYSAGHRGIDIAVPFGTPVHSSAAGTVTFAGFVAGSMFVTVDHGDGIRTTYSFLSGISVSRGQAVKAGEVLGFTGHGHLDVATPHLHFGARIDGVYVDPLLLLGGLDLVDLIRLAPLAR